MMKRLLLFVASAAAQVWRIVPASLRRRLVFGLFVLEGRAGDAAQGLRNLLLLKDSLDLAINERAMGYGAGEHPKHRLTQYHAFFIDSIAPGARVLDIGCGYGAVARSIALAVPTATVLGVDLDDGRLAQAQAANNPPNLSFLRADATKSLPPGPWTVVVLSNVLEHIDDRVGFLKSVLATASPGHVLIRVPLFERDWQMPLRRELRVNYLSDSDHRIEHTVAELTAELREAGLEIVAQRTPWGEIWTRCRPASP
jgi:ubiquinone/menaquinone biosynthesis C-methylase UbiE